MDGELGLVFTGLFEPGATWNDLIYDPDTGIPKFSGPEQTWRLMFEYNFANYRWMWDNLPEDNLRR
jgi:hypothetical protein